MNQKQLTLLIVLGLVIGGLGLLVSKKRSASWNQNGGGVGEKILGDFPINDVTHVRIKQTNAELNLVKGDIWTVKERWGYPANFSEVAGLIRKLADLKAVSPMTVGASQLGRLDLLAPDNENTANAGTLLELLDKEARPVKSLLLGKQQMRGGGSDDFSGGYPVGRYLMVPGNAKSVSVVSETFSDVSTRPESWLSKDWFKVEKLKSISVTSPAATNNWKLARETETGSWSLVDKTDEENVDTAKLSSVSYALSSPSFNDVLDPAADAAITGMDNARVATLETFDGFTYTVKIGSVDADDNYTVNAAVAASFARQREVPADEKPEDKDRLDKEFTDKLAKLDEKLKKEQSFARWTYRVSKWTIDPLLKNRGEFLVAANTERAADGHDHDAEPSPVNLPDVLNTLPSLEE